MTLETKLTRMQTKPFTGYMTIDLKSAFHFLGILSPHLVGLRHRGGASKVPAPYECAEQVPVGPHSLANLELRKRD